MGKAVGNVNVLGTFAVSPASWLTVYLLRVIQLAVCTNDRSLRQ